MKYKPSIWAILVTAGILCAWGAWTYWGKDRAGNAVRPNGLWHPRHKLQLAPVSAAHPLSAGEFEAHADAEVDLLLWLPMTLDEARAWQEDCGGMDIEVSYATCVDSIVYCSSYPVSEWIVTSNGLRTGLWHPSLCRLQLINGCEVVVQVKVDAESIREDVTLTPELLGGGWELP